MEYIIKNRSPERLFRYFEEICAIPHPSYREEKVADYLVAFANERGLEYYRDEMNNVLIKKPATRGEEHRSPILFQGHTDMVCEKNADVDHDFLKDPLRLFLDGDLLGAAGTTLGGDDGIAVAAMLAILDGALAAHPPIECLFTVCEEVGLDGAQNFDYSRITARRLINMDSEVLGVVTAGCTGGLRSELALQTGVEKNTHDCLEIFVHGLAGGHSGCDIHRGRANANRLMGRLLAAVPDARLVSLNGGSKDNAIPRECRAQVSVADAAAAEKRLRDVAAEISCEMCADDRGFSLEIIACARAVETFDEKSTHRAIAILTATQNGVLEWHRDVDGLVEYSRNLGVVRTEGNTVTFVFSSRSSMEGRLDATVRELDALGASLGCKTHHHSRYPGWSYAPVSKVRDAYLRAYREVTGKDCRVEVIHAGLECGIIYSRLPDMDMISVGPTMYDIHSPSERLDLSSTETFWKTIVRVVELL